MVALKQRVMLESVKNKIEKDELASALEELKGVVAGSEYQNEVLNSMARLSSITKQSRLGVIDVQTADMEKNKIRNSTLEIVHKIEELQERGRIKYVSFSNNKFFFSKKNIFLICIMLIVLACIMYFNRQETTGIKGTDNDNNEIHISN